MALDTVRIVVTTTATRLDSTETDRDAGESISIYNDSAGTVYLGASDVDVSSGYPLAPATHLSFDLDDDEHLYGRVASGTATVRVIETGL